uniref:Putative cobalt-zinc-cadmium resistance protein CzcA n=1 Tax=Candidatus Criblamydia sequanensis CRIB-18 TaxID=1437425 RepID=A0A090D394_9BACT|nr:CusA/CzcA family heavy metal efflux RND transporter [Criblamydia sequanensis]CDR35296.1 putative cobalt-zinc-cadmium resistance protein CzcA [Criblamydia sequanensis CRIB-18]
MIEKILRFSIHYPLAIILFTLVITGFGIYSFTRLPIDAVPDITNNQVQINTTLPGFSPIQIEKQVTYVIETALAGIPGLQMTRSLSRNAFSQVTAIFDDDVNIYFARQQINERLNEIKENIPDGAEPRMGPISTGLGEVYMWTVDFKHPNGKGAELKEGSPGWQKDGSYLTPEGQFLKTDIEKASYLRTVQDWIVKPQLKGVKGLAGIDSIGGYVRQYHVEPNLERMIALGLSFDDIISSLKRNNASVGPGYIEKKGESLLIKSDERLDAPIQIETIVLATIEGIPIRVRDIAEVIIGKEMRTGSGSKDGHEAVVGTALMLIGANSRTVSQAVDEKLKEVNKTLPTDIEAKSVLNRTKLVNATIKTVLSNLGEGAILVIAVLFLFLGNFRAALITAMVIPLSMLMTATGMVQSKISGNLMSLGAIDFGLIVDGAVIITENCLRRLTQKQHELGRTLELNERLQELVLASKEMIQPTVFGQAIIITVYIPILTLTGVEGKMFHPMAMTVIFALIAAFVLSLTFVPAMIAVFIKGHLKEKENKIVEYSKRLYSPILDKSLKFPRLAISLGVIIFASSLILFYRLGQEFVPTLDERDIAMHAMRIPSTSLTQSTEMQTMVEKMIKKFPQVDYVYSKTGTAEMASDPMPPNVSDTFIILKPKEEWPDPSLDKTGLIELIQNEVNKIPGNNYEFTQPIEMRFNELISGVRSDLAVKIYGDDFDVMQRTADDIANILRKIPGSADVKIAQTKGLPVLDVKIDREAASRLGINVADGLDVLAVAAGGGKAGQIFEGDRRFDILVRLPETQREDIKALENLPIPLPVKENSGNKIKAHFPYVPLSEIADLKVSDGLNEIRREDGKRFISVQSNVRGRDLGSYVEEAKQKIQKEVKIPDGYWISWGGQFENLISARQRLFIVVPICLGLIFLLLYTAFNSIRYALLVFSGVPLALTGGIAALWVRDMPFSISAAVGFIALSGIAVLNGLVLITCINQLLAEKDDLNLAIKDGSLMRLRPVLMTALVAALGFVPMALATGTGAEVQKPLATVVIGGLISSTFLTLILLPALYYTFSPPHYRKSKYLTSNGNGK